MGNIHIELEEFEKMHTDDKLNTLYKAVVYHQGNTEGRLGKLESKRLADKVWAGGGGIVGGILVSFWYRLVGN